MPHIYEYIEMSFSWENHQELKKKIKIRVGIFKIFEIRIPFYMPYWGIVVKAKMIYIIVNKLKHSDTTIVTIPSSDGDRVATTFVCSIVHALTKIDAKSIQ